jgi:hypothetical protein
MLRTYHLGLILLCVPLGWAQQEVEPENLVPAGTLLQCTLDEPNFSSQTAQVGDPVLCHLNTLQMFGKPLITRGAYLSARLQDFRDPGHFVGKGWLQLEFTSLTLPSGSFPLNAKVISAARYKVNAEGKIRGHGHPVRDALEWSLPILWPMKVLTLPARGPRPAFKGETRIGLRLMEDLYIPDSKPRGLNSRSSTSGPKTGDKTASVPSSRPGIVLVENNTPAQQPTLSITGQLQTSSFEHPAQPAAVNRRPTLMALRGGDIYLAADYWVESGNLDYIIVGGGPKVVPLASLDLTLTRRINAERGVLFMLTAKYR